MGVQLQNLVLSGFLCALGIGYAMRLAKVTLLLHYVVRCAPSSADHFEMQLHWTILPNLDYMLLCSLAKV